MSNNKLLNLVVQIYTVNLERIEVKSTECYPFIPYQMILTRSIDPKKRGGVRRLGIGTAPVHTFGSSF